MEIGTIRQVRSQLVKEFRELSRSAFGFLMLVVWIVISILYTFVFYNSYSPGVTYTVSSIIISYWTGLLYFSLVFLIIPAFALSHEVEDGIYGILRSMKVHLGPLMIGKIMIYLLFFLALCLVPLIVFYGFAVDSNFALYGLKLKSSFFGYMVEAMFLFYLLTLIPLGQSFFVSSLTSRRVTSLMLVVGFFFVVSIASSSIINYYYIHQNFNTAHVLLQIPVVYQPILIQSPYQMRGLFDDVFVHLSNPSPHHGTSTALLSGTYAFTNAVNYVVYSVTECVALLVLALLVFKEKRATL
ncbi:MAG: hypothetical protein JRN15_21530 [Nitrososphaerota archaeon]|nr:hypothetical protein [Nitrososphaerota archaeon]